MTLFSIPVNPILCFGVHAYVQLDAAHVACCAERHARVANDSNVSATPTSAKALAHERNRLALQARDLLSFRSTQWIGSCRATPSLRNV